MSLSDDGVRWVSAGLRVVCRLTRRVRGITTLHSPLRITELDAPVTCDNFHSISAPPSAAMLATTELYR